MGCGDRCKRRFASGCRRNTFRIRLVPTSHFVGSPLVRPQVAELLREWDKRYPGRVETIFRALGNVVPTHLLDRALNDFAAIHPPGVPVQSGDLAFDEDPCSEGTSNLQIALAERD